MCKSPSKSFEEGESKERVPGSTPCGRVGEKGALYWWESLGGSFLNAHGRTASVDLSFFLSPSKRVDRLKNKGTRHVFHIGVLLGHIHHIQMCAPATVMPQFSGCEHANESALCFSSCACLNQDANT
eukprot:1149496-Pelagomonas_calceolata.AAC.2